MRLTESLESGARFDGHNDPEAADVAFINGIACGRVSALDALFRRYGPRLRRFLGRSTHWHAA